MVSAVGSADKYPGAGVGTTVGDVVRDVVAKGALRSCLWWMG